MIRPFANSFLWACRSGFDHRVSLQTGCVAEYMVGSRLGAVSGWSGDGAESELGLHAVSQMSAGGMLRPMAAMQPMTFGL